MADGGPSRYERILIALLILSTAGYFTVQIGSWLGWW